MYNVPMRALRAGDVNGNRTLNDCCSHEEVAGSCWILCAPRASMMGQSYRNLSMYGSRVLRTI